MFLTTLVRLLFKKYRQKYKENKKVTDDFTVQIDFGGVFLIENMYMLTKFK